MRNVGENEESAETDGGTPAIRVPAYHRRLCEYFRSHFPDLWRRFADLPPQFSADDTIDRLASDDTPDQLGHPVFYLQCEALSLRMQLQVPITLYRTRKEGGTAASLIFVPQHVHLVVSGPVIDKLTEAESEVLFAFHLAHFELLSADSGDIGILHRLLGAMRDTCNGDAVVERTFERYEFWSAVFCDYRVASVTDCPQTHVSALIRSQYVDARLNVEEWLKAGEQSSDDTASDAAGRRKNELIFRASVIRDLQLLSEIDSGRIRDRVEGQLSLATLDILQQNQIQDATCELLNRFLSPRWLQTSALTEYADRMCMNFRDPPSNVPDGELARAIQTGDSDTRHYFCAILLDLATLDPALCESALAAAYLFSKEVGLFELFQQLTEQELHLGVRFRERVLENAEAIVGDAAAGRTN